MKGPRAQRSLCERTRPTKPTASTIRGQTCVEEYDGDGYVHMPPMTRGMKYHVFFLMSWKMWRRVVNEKATTKMIAATWEG
jgi:hypothetical protein